MNHSAHGITPATAATAENGGGDTRRRQRWMAVLARASREELEDIVAALPPQPAWQWLRRPETGLAMLQGRAGGTGARFNLGEASITRCTLRTAASQTAASRNGYACVLGRDHRKAELAALLDALLQDGDDAGHVTPTLAHTVQQRVEQLAAGQSSRRELAGRKTAATRVDFYTLVRGESS